MSSRNCGIAWDNKYRLGEERVDTQHKHIFELLGELIDQCSDGSNTEYLDETLEFLVEYTVQHFYDEEALQVRYNFPDYRRHKRLHEDFKVVVSALVQRYAQSGSSSELSSDVNKIVVRWLIEHILVEDSKIGEHVRKVTARTLSA